MARLARIVVPDLPHRVTARGNRREPIFFEDGDQHIYRDLLAERLVSAHGGSHPEDLSEDQPGACHHPGAPGGGGDSGITWADGSLWVGQKLLIVSGAVPCSPGAELV